MQARVDARLLSLCTAAYQWPAIIHRMSHRRKDYITQWQRLAKSPQRGVTERYFHLTPTSNCRGKVQGHAGYPGEVTFCDKAGPIEICSNYFLQVNFP